jgi:hypothetical protein
MPFPDGRDAVLKEKLLFADNLEPDTNAGSGSLVEEPSVFSICRNIVCFIHFCGGLLW